MGKIKKILLKIKDHILGFFHALWHRNRHAFRRRFEKSPIKNILDFFGLCAWLFLVLTAKDEFSQMAYIAAAVMLVARVWPVLEAFWSDDKGKTILMAKRRIEANACIKEINFCLENNAYATEEKIKEIRQKLINCIGDTARAYRNDVHGNTIFSNLLIPEGDYLRVAVRNDPERTGGTRHKKSDLKCSEVLESRKALFCGNVQKTSYPKRETKYKSFMAIPVLDTKKEQCLAIVTIDSVEFHHFDGIYETLDTLLGPYISTITTTFIIQTMN
jgi:hypothetical protein